MPSEYQYDLILQHRAQKTAWSRVTTLAMDINTDLSSSGTQSQPSEEVHAWISPWPQVVAQTIHISIVPSGSKPSDFDLNSRHSISHVLPFGIRWQHRPQISTQFPVATVLPTNICLLGGITDHHGLLRRSSPGRELFLNSGLTIYQSHEYPHAFGQAGVGEEV